MRRNPYIHVYSLGLTAFLLLACAGPNPPIRQAPEASTQADAVLPTGKNLFVFDFAHSRFQKWPLPDGDSAHACRIVDTLRGAWSVPSHWFALSTPAQPFQASQAIWGPNGNFFLLDRVGKRLVLYDTSAQFLSAFPLPQEIRDRNLNRIEIHWTRDGMFSFLDLAEAKVWKYAEQRSTGGSGDWQLRYTFNLPVGLETCLWEPYTKHPVCLRRGSSALVFDEYFNPTGGGMELRPMDGMYPVLTPGGRSWRLEFDPGETCGTGPGYSYSPEGGEFFTVPVTVDTTAPHSGAIPSQP